MAQPSRLKFRSGVQGFKQLLLGHSNFVFAQSDGPSAIRTLQTGQFTVASVADCPVVSMVPYSQARRLATAACLAALVAISCLDTAFAQTAASAASSSAPAPSAAPFQTLVDPALFTGVTSTLYYASRGHWLNRYCRAKSARHLRNYVRSSNRESTYIDYIP